MRECVSKDVLKIIAWFAGIEAFNCLGMAAPQKVWRKIDAPVRHEYFFTAPHPANR